MPVAHVRPVGSVSCAVFIVCTVVQGQLDVISASAGQGSKKELLGSFGICLFRLFVFSEVSRTHGFCISPKLWPESTK